MRVTSKIEPMCIYSFDSVEDMKTFVRIADQDGFNVNSCEYAIKTNGLRNKFRVNDSKHITFGTYAHDAPVYPAYERVRFKVVEEKEMPKCKFKIGDKVKVKRGFYHGHKDGGIGVICDSGYLVPNAYFVEIKGFVQLVKSEDLELVKETKNPRIIRLGDLKIVFNGDYTIVTDGRFTGKAKRHADDEYDAIKGLEIAMMRYEIDGGFCLE